MSLPFVKCENQELIGLAEKPLAEAAVWRRVLPIPMRAKALMPASCNGEVLIRINNLGESPSVEVERGGREHLLSAPDEYFAVNLDSADFMSILRICVTDVEMILEFRRVRNQHGLEALDERIRETVNEFVASRLQTLDTLKKLQPRLLKVPELK